MTAPATGRPRSWPGRPADRIVVACGVASIAFGFGIATLAVVGRPGVGSFGLVPEVIAGFTSVILGVMAVWLGRPASPAASNRVAAWLLLGAGIVATASVVVLALDDLAGPIEENRQIASIVVVLGRSVVQAGLVWLGVVLLLRALGIVFGWLLAAWRSRYLR